jgi:limonene-1,2-epoxide hydrolase
MEGSMRHKLAIAFVIASTACITNIAYPTDETQVVTFTLNHATSPDAATVLRTITGVRKFEVADDHILTVRDTRENLELAAAVVKMLDTTDDTADTTTLPAGDGLVIAAVVLDRVSSEEVMGALRRELRIARIATAGEKRVFLRDTDSQIQAALKVIGRLEGNHEDP